MNTKICTLSPENVYIMEFVLNIHNVTFTLEKFTGVGGKHGVRVFIPSRLRIFFVEIVQPEYRELLRTPTNVDLGKKFEDTLSNMFKQVEQV